MSNFQDSIQILRCLSFSRFWNLMRLKVSFILSKITKNPKTSALPFSLSIEPTTACNLGCPECPSGLKKFTRPTGKLNLELNKKLLAQVKNHIGYINYYFQGEPFLNPDFLGLIKEADKHKIYTSTSTNAHFINDKNAEEIVKSGLKRLIISIDGLTQETYENYRIHGSLKKVLEGSKAMVEAKKKLKSKTPHLIFQFLAVAPNEHEIPEVFNLAKEMEIDEVRIKTAQFYEYENGNILMPKDENYSRYRKKLDGTFELKSKMQNHCWRMWSGGVVTWDGKVVPCCFDKDAQFVLGNLNTNSYAEIWNSEKYVAFRKQVIMDRSQIEICKNCSEGTKVWA